MLVHAVLLLALAMIQQSLENSAPQVLLETFFEPERVQEEFERVLEVDTEVATTHNLVSGGAVTAAVGGTEAPAVEQAPIDTKELLQEPEVRVNPSEFFLPGDQMLGVDLGESEVSGEVGAVVEGYGPAMSRITQELIRLMRQQKLLVVWLFDESESMKDDQQEIAQKFHKVYEELGIQQQKDTTLRRGRARDAILETAVFGFGKNLHPLTPKPTADEKQVVAAIDRIAVDDSGDENMFQSIITVLGQFGLRAARADRRLVIVVVTDESPSDEQYLEEAIGRCKRMKVPVYILGREAIFGYPYARIVWRDPKYNLPHWIRINRGPETARPECLQYNGLHARWDSFSSGFGPYSQVRLCKETGGIFFILPGEEQNLTGPGAHEKRRFDALAMKEYEPLLLPVRVYEEQRDSNPFRKAIWDVIYRLNPHQFPELSLKVHHYSIVPEEFTRQAAPQFARAVNVMLLLNQAVEKLESVRSLRAVESSRRWQANFDLIIAQCLSYRFRVFQYMLVLDRHSVTRPKVQNPKNNEWNVGWSKRVVVPSEEQYKRIQQFFRTRVSRDEFLAELERQKNEAERLYRYVIDEHPGTPWARRAQYELGLGFGMEIREGYWSPNYAKVGKEIKIPKF